MLIELGILFLTNVVTAIVSLVITFAFSIPLKLRLSLVVTLLGLLLWQDSVYVSNTIFSESVFWNNFLFIWPTVAVLSSFIFINLLNEHKNWRGNKSLTNLEWLSAGGTALGFLVQVVAIATWHLFVQGAEPGILERGDSYPIYIVGLIVSLLSVLGYLVLSVVKTAHSHSRQRQAVQTIFYTVLLAVVYGLITSVVLPIVTGAQTYSGLGVLTIVIFSVGFSLSIVRGRLLDVRLYAVRSATYILSLATLATVYGLISFGILQFILKRADPSLYTIANIALALGVALVFQPVKQFFNRITNKIFFRDNYDSDEFFSQLGRELAVTSDLRDLMERASEYISKTLKAEQAFFFIYKGENSWAQAGTRGHRRLALQDALSLDQATRGAAIVSSFTLSKEDAQLHRLLTSYRLAIVLPLRRGRDTIGYFLLGDHRQGTYTRRDLLVLGTVADEVGIAIQNALSIQEVKDLNAHLEQRIASATRQLRTSNAQLQRLDEAKDEFISMASHQLRTPLTSIKGYISMLMEGDIGKVTPQQKHLLGEAFNSSERMVRLISDFLNVSRLQTGKFVIDKHPVDLGLLVQREVEALEHAAESHGLSLVYKRPKNIPLIDLDENKIQQVVMNFTDNAIYYSNEKGKITVTLKKVPGAVEFTVKDNGIGVPVAEREELFTKFFRATNARKQRPDGTGVGLFLAKKVITDHGGEMIFASEEGKGSTFGFRLPIQKK